MAGEQGERQETNTLSLKRKPQRELGGLRGGGGVGWGRQIPGLRHYPSVIIIKIS